MASDPSHMHSLLMPRRLKSLIALLALTFAAVAAAQVPTLTPEQLQIFSNLTPEEQRALMEQVATPDQQGAARQPSSTNQPPPTDESRRRTTEDQQRQPEVPVMSSEDTVLVEARVPTVEDGQPARDPADLARLQGLVDLIRSRNPYQLDRLGQLNLPGFASIALRGLTDRQATQRLSLEPALLGLDMRLSRLPLEQSGIAGLKPFGYGLFDNAASTFSPVTDVPVTAEYVVGPGDKLNVQLYGSQNRSLRLTVSRDGAVNFPELGPIRVSGMTFNSARQAIETRVTQQMIGVQASITMDETRTIRVFVLGEARQPGSHAVSGQTTVTGALFAAGGVTPIGSLRDIQLKRQGNVVRRLDLYDMLIRGDTSDDAWLLPGDTIFIPPVGSTVSVDGEVKRPAIYELRDESTVAEVVRIAGGMTPEADATRVSLTQVDQASRRVVTDVNLTQQAGAAQRVGNGAVLRVGRLRPQIDSGIELEGHVHRPGPVAWRDGLRLTDVIGSVDELRPNADQNYILIRRESGTARRISVLSADLAAALAAPSSDANVELAPRDRIIVFDLAPGRERIIQPLLQDLRLQSGLAQPTELVTVGGRVKVPGEYPLEPDMRVNDLLRAGGNLDSAAFGGEAELTRYTVSEDGARHTELIHIDLAAVLRGDGAANIALRPFDYLIIKETPDWGEQESITLRGEVRFPGTYPIRKGETLRQVLDRAGGLTTGAFPEGSAFTRSDLRVLEQQQIDRLTERMRADLAGMALKAANAGQSSATDALQSGQSLLLQLQSARATGRFVIDLPGLLAMESGSVKDVLLRNGDELFIPKLRQEVSVIGEVQNGASYQYLPNLTRDDYVHLSGGATRTADRGRIYVVRADGSVASRPGSWFRRSYDVAIKPGDTIIVPLNTERMPRLPFWQAVTQILYNLAVSVAAVNSF
jgi:polysaccharide export outer membrane protein